MSLSSMAAEGFAGVPFTPPVTTQTTPSASSRRRRRGSLARRELRAAQRAMRRAQIHLMDFVMLWADDAFVGDNAGFLRQRDALVQRYRAAQRRVLLLSNGDQL